MNLISYYLKLLLNFKLIAAVSLCVQKKKNRDILIVPIMVEYRVSQFTKFK